MIGILTSDGVFHKCNSFCHMEKAAELCDSIGIQYNGILDAETQLLDRGAVIFTARNAYCSYYISDKSLSDKVVDFLKNNIGNYNNSDQEEAVKAMLDNNDYMTKWKGKFIRDG